jgi:hypothetical protein
MSSDTIAVKQSEPFTKTATWPLLLKRFGKDNNKTPYTRLNYQAYIVFSKKDNNKTPYTRLNYQTYRVFSKSPGGIRYWFTVTSRPWLRVRILLMKSPPPESFAPVGVETIDERTRELLPREPPADNESDDDASEGNEAQTEESGLEGSQGSLDTTSLCRLRTELGK